MHTNTICGKVVCFRQSLTEEHSNCQTNEKKKNVCAIEFMYHVCMKNWLMQA